MLSFPLLGRCRSWALLSLLSLLALSTSPAAHAGSYSGPSYSGGTCIEPPFTGHPIAPYALGTSSINQGSYSGYGGDSGGNQGGGASCSGAITTTFTWQPAPGQTLTTDPAPQNVIVQEVCMAAASGTSIPAATVGGSCDNGLGASQGSLTQTPQTYAYPPIVYGMYGSGFCNSTRYQAMSGQATMTLTCSPSASASASMGTGASVRYSAAIYPVTLNLAGTTPDSSGNLNILIGQHCSASLVGIPSNCTVSNYQWSVSGTTFQTWSADTPANGNNPYNPDASYEVDGPGPLTNPTAGWYWNDLNQTPETVSCTATVTPPAGQGSAFTVTLTQKVTVMVPGWTCKGIGGNMQVNTANPASNGTDYWLWAGPTAGTSEVAGMEWDATVSPPSGTTFGAGSLEMVQLVIPNKSYTTTGLFGSTVTHSWSMNGQEGLDTTYPYGWDTGAPGYEGNDNPGFDLTAVNAQSAQIGDQFEDYLMYFAPGSTQCVPLARFVWSTNGSATIPSTNNWANFGSGSAGTVTPSGTRKFGLSNAFPMWTQIITATSGSF